ncbi:conjugal transfer protein TrbC [Delftia sp. GW456-R20]|nr:conjugal transfer protein TrbC [Delftia sp. GW456-R20]
MRLREQMLVAYVLVASSPAFAQLEKAKSSLTTISNWLLSVGVVIITIAVMFVGFRMSFQAAQWKDVAPVFWGGVLVGAASGIASMLIG